MSHYCFVFTSRYVILAVVSVLASSCLFSSCDEAAEEPVVISDFDFTLNTDDDPLKVTFINLSENANFYSWDFGDGTTSTEKDPIKLYTASGDYSVTLTSSASSGEKSVSKNVQLPKETCYLSKTTTTAIAGGATSSVDFVYDNHYKLIKMGPASYDYDSEGRQLNSETFSSAYLDVYGNPCRYYETVYEYINEETVIGSSHLTLSEAGCPILEGSGSAETYHFKNGKLMQLISESYPNYKDSTAFIYCDNNIQEYRHYTKSNTEAYELYETALYEYDAYRNPLATNKLLSKDHYGFYTHSENNVVKTIIENSIGTYVSEYSYTYNEKGYPATKNDGVRITQYEYFCLN